MSLVVLLFYFVLIGYSSVNSSNTGGCKINDFSETDWDVNVLAISDTQTNQNIFESKYEGTLENIECTDNEFFNVAKNETYFFVATTDDFKNFDLHTEKTNSNSVSQKLACTMTCSNGESSVNILIRVTDTNNHDPSFDSLDAEYKVATPIMPMADFSLYGTPIVVTDIDFSNQNVTFTMDPDDFTCSTQSTSDSKQYRAVFRANKIIQIEDSKEYTLTATDSGTNPKTRSVSKKITLVSDPASSFDRPTFQRASYSFTYAEKDGKCSLTPNDGDITLITNKPNDIHGFSITGDLKDNFEVKFDNSTKTISISCLTPVKSTQSISVLSISVETDSVSAIPVVLYLADIPAIGPKFSSIWYTAEYDRTSAKVSLNQEIGVTPSTATLELSDSSESSYKKYFELKKESDKYEVVVSEPLPDSILNNQNSIVLTITATLDAVTSKATLVINIPAAVQSSSIRFEKVLYSGSYEVVTGAVTFTTDSIKIIDTETGDRDIVVKISEDSSYSTYFTATYANKVVTIGNAKDLPEDILKSMSFIPLTLEASVSGLEDSSSAVLNVIIKYDTPEDNSHINFGNILYDGTYANKNGSIKINSEITIDTDQADNVEVSITNEYKEYFTATYSDKKVTIALSNPGSPKSFESKVVSLVLQAKIKSTSHTAQTVLNLQVEDNSTGDTSYITFGNILYDGSYANKNGSIKINSEITIDTDQADNVEVSITNEYKEYFTATYSDRKVTIALSNPDSPKSFESRVVSVVLQAKIKSTSHTAQTVLNLQVEDGSSEDTSFISFSKTLYEGKYIATSNSITIDEEITVNTDKVDDIEVSIINEYKEYFTVQYAEKKLTVTLLKPISSETLKSVSLISILLQGSLKSTSLTSQAVVNLKVIVGELSLKSSLYNGKYEVEDNKASIFHDKITVETDQEDDEVDVKIINGYDSDFNVAYSKKEVQVTLLRETASKTLLSLPNIPILIQIMIKDTPVEVNAVLNLRVYGDGKEDTKTLSFSRPLYSGNYSIHEAESVGHLEIEPLSLITNLMDNEIEVTLSNEYDYDKLFEVSQQNGNVVINIKGEVLPDIVLTQEKFLALTVNAKIIETGSISSAVLNIRIYYNDNQNGDTSKTSVTGYIVAVAILAVLLVGLIVATVGFYVWKRKSESYEKMLDDTGSNKVKFEQRDSRHSINEIKRKASSALEERRPTGFVYRKFDENGDEIVKEPVTEPIERRKSVAFDDNIEKLQIDPIVDDDIDKALEETEPSNTTAKEEGYKSEEI